MELLHITYETPTAKGTPPTISDGITSAVSDGTLPGVPSGITLLQKLILKIPEKTFEHIPTTGRILEEMPEGFSHLHEGSRNGILEKSRQKHLVETHKDLLEKS